MSIFAKGAQAAATVATLFLATAAAAQEEVVDTRPYFPTDSQQLLDLIRDCDTDQCMSYVSGAIGGIAVYALIAEKPSPFCTRGEIREDEIREAIVQTLETTPQLLEQHPAVSILTAFGRYWPCMTQEEMDTLQSTAMTPVDSDAVAELMASGNHSITLGNENAPANKTIMVFHDPNCPHCKRFRSETDKLVQLGWKVMVFPVATSSEESADYGAVEIALRDSHPEASKALYRNDIEGLSDITMAMEIAEMNGVPNKDLLTRIARGGTYQGVESNTRAFFDMGAKGTPSWIVGLSLYSGYLNAESIAELTADFEDEASEAAAASDQPLDQE
jgi:protein-disulfide isomerase